MEIVRDEDKRIIEVWLTKAESTDDVLQSRLRPLYKKWKQEKYLTCVYRSGDRDLQEQTAALLLHNRDYFAQKEVEAAKKAMAALS